VVLALAHYLGAKSCCSTLSEEFIVVLLDIKLFLDVHDFRYGNVTSALKSICDFQWMDTLVEELLSLLEDCSSKNNNTSCTISDFVVLGGG
jgi:hypothetical protein